MRAPLSNWRRNLGRRYRIGYYGENDGLDCIWLVDEKGAYCAWVDHAWLGKYCHVERLANEENLYGYGRPQFGPLEATAEVRAAYPPPGTLLQFTRVSRALALISARIGQFFRVDYYSPEVGLNAVFLADELGRPCGRMKRERLLQHFQIVRLAEGSDYCGIPQLDALPVELQLEQLRMGRKPVPPRAAGRLRTD